jgi:hypothetical protein
MRGTCADRAPVTARQAMQAHPEAHALGLLIVLEGVLSEDQVRPLLPALAPDTVLITNRSMPTALGPAVHVDLAPLAGYEARQLLTKLCGAGRAEAEPTQLVRPLGAAVRQSAAGAVHRGQPAGATAGMVHR